MTPQEKALFRLLGQKTIASRAPSKKKSHEYFKAIKNHKKRPDLSPKKRKQTPHEKAFKAMTPEEYEKKYNPFND